MSEPIYPIRTSREVTPRCKQCRVELQIAQGHRYLPEHPGNQWHHPFPLCGIVRTVAHTLESKDIIFDPPDPRAKTPSSPHAQDR